MRPNSPRPFRASTMANRSHRCFKAGERALAESMKGYWGAFVRQGAFRPSPGVRAASRSIPPASELISGRRWAARRRQAARPAPGARPAAEARPAVEHSISGKRSVSGKRLRQGKQGDTIEAIAPDAATLRSRHVARRMDCGSSWTLLRITAVAVVDVGRAQVAARCADDSQG
jgi:hypothetical protein